MNSSQDYKENQPSDIFKHALDKTHDGICIFKVNNSNINTSQIHYVNQSFCNLRQLKIPEILGLNPTVIFGKKTDQRTKEKLCDALTNQHAIQTEILYVTKTGTEIWLEFDLLPLTKGKNNVAYFMTIEKDVTPRKSLEMSHYQETNRDALTGVLNRQRAYQLAEEILKQAKDTNERYCSIMLNVDHLKKISSVYGHSSGDNVLKGIAQLIKQQIRRSDIIGRVGEGEFFLLLCDISLKQAEMFSKRIKQLIETEIKYDNEVKKSVTASIGITQLKPCDTLESMINRTDCALTNAKNKGTNYIAIL